MKTIRMKVKRDAYAWLNAAAVEVNQVWNWANQVSADACDRNLRANAKFLTGFDLTALTAGACECFSYINSDAINEVALQYVKKRREAKRCQLRWRVSSGPRRSLGWVPFKHVGLKRKGRGFRFCGKSFRVFNRAYLGDMNWRGGSFSQDAVGDWWLCLPVETPAKDTPAPREIVGIDLGIKTIATTSDGDALEAGRWTYANADRLANAQRRGHKRQAKRIHRKIARCRADALHKFSRKIVDQYQTIVIGDVSSSSLTKTTMAKAVSDSGWYALKTQLQYKGEHAGRFVQIVNERNTTRACSDCGSLSGPAGLAMLVVRDWICADCGSAHDRDVNAAKNIRSRAKALASVSRNETNECRPRRGVVEVSP